jgi:AcrR family transcriptional regulator
MHMTTPLSSASPSRVRSTKLSASEGDTRDCIVRAALTLFAKHGIDGVSLRQIVTAAGQSNPSAVHYHFQSKEGLVNAVVAYVVDTMQPMQDQALGAMAEAERQGTLTVREVVRLTTMPMILTYSSGRDGRVAIRFLSRLTWQPQHVGRGQLIERVWQYIVDVVAVLQKLLPDRSPDALRFLTVMFISNLVHGLADISLLGRQPTLGMSAVYSERPFELIDWYVDYVTAGLSGPDHQALLHPSLKSFAA